MMHCVCECFAGKMMMMKEFSNFLKVSSTKEVSEAAFKSPLSATAAFAYNASLRLYLRVVNSIIFLQAEFLGQSATKRRMQFLAWRF